MLTVISLTSEMRHFEQHRSQNKKMHRQERKWLMLLCNTVGKAALDATQSCVTQFQDA